MKTLLISFVLALSVMAQQPPLRPVKVTLTSAATDIYAGTATPTLSAYVSGQILMFTANTANTGAASINVDAVGDLTIVKLGGGIATALADNDIRSGQQVMCQYDGTNCQMLSQLGNAAAASGGAAVLVGYGNATVQTTGNITYYAFANINPASSDDPLQLPVRAGTLQNLRMIIGTTQGNADLVCTIWKVAAGSAYGADGAATSVVMTIAANSAAGQYASTGTATTADGDRIYMRCVQGAGASSGPVRLYSLELQ